MVRFETGYPGTQQHPQETKSLMTINCGAKMTGEARIATPVSLHSNSPSARSELGLERTALERTASEDPPGIVSRCSNDEDDPKGEYGSDCDYDKNPTVLYKLLETSSWDKAMERCQTHPVEASVWVVRRNKDNNNTRWKILPLHAAIIFRSPTNVLKVLLEKYPASASLTDDQGMLPLHLAFRHKHDDETLLEHLLIQHPKAVTSRDNRDRVPLELGKDGHFSAKFMSLYANTVVTASTTSIGARESFVSQQIHEYETQLSNAHFAREEEVSTVKKLYEERISMLKQQHQVEMDRLSLESETAKQRLQVELRKAAPISPAMQSSEIFNKLKDQNQNLQTELNHTRSEYEIMETVCKGLRVQNSELVQQVGAIGDDFQQLQGLLQQQHEDLEAAQAMRAQLLRTLMQQDNEDRSSRLHGGEEITELGEQIRAKLQKVCSRTQSRRQQQSTPIQVRILDTPNKQADDISAITEHSNY